MKTFPNPKINIGLNILCKRPDGYHNLESLFVPYFGLRDVLEIEEASKPGIEIRRYESVDGVEVERDVDWKPESDLTMMAWKALERDFRIPPVHIYLEKHIPVGAGLGGGSADASFALGMMSEMFDLFLPDVLLADYAAALGSDCPFFVYDRPMFASGRGEVLEPYDAPALDNYDVRLIVPQGVSVATKEAYAGIVPASPQVPLKEALALPVPQWRDCVVNDFEKTVFAVHPSLAEMKSRLYAEGAAYAAMSGSGSALFGLFEKQ